MFAATVRPLLTLAIAASALSLAGCGKQAAADAATGAPAAHSAQPAAAKVNYWKTIAPFVAGEYAAQCLPFPEPKPYPDTLRISPQGRITAQGFNEDLAQASSLVLGRASDKGVTENAMVAEIGDFHLAMMVRSEGGVATWTASKDGKQALCEKSAEMAGIKGKTWVLAIAPLLTTLPRKVTCIATGNIKQEQVEFRLTDGSATINGEVFDLKNASQESVIFSDGLAALHYSATFPDQRVLQLEYGASGKLDKISGKGNNEQLYVCNI